MLSDVKDKSEQYYRFSCPACRSLLIVRLSAPPSRSTSESPAGLTLDEPWQFAIDFVFSLEAQTTAPASNIFWPGASETAVPLSTRVSPLWIRFLSDLLERSLKLKKTWRDRSKPRCWTEKSGKGTEGHNTLWSWNNRIYIISGHLFSLPDGFFSGTLAWSKIYQRCVGDR